VTKALLTYLTLNFLPE